MLHPFGKSADSESCNGLYINPSVTAALLHSISSVIPSPPRFEQSNSPVPAFLNLKASIAGSRKGKIYVII